jgi:hypothetical protein
VLESVGSTRVAAISTFVSRTPLSPSDGTVTVVDFPGALETEIGGIDDRGDICGFWVDPKTGFWTAFVAFKQ